MQMNFADRLFTSVRDKNSVVVAGLDPRVEMLPPQLLDATSASNEEKCDAILQFNIGLIESVGQYIAAVKPQIAFYEAFGPEGMRVFAQTCRYAAKAGLLVIADVKRGDIGSTATAYANAYFGSQFPSDAMTVNPYLGSDAIKPFTDRCSDGYGVFALVRTSNPGAKDLQDIKTPNGRLFEEVADIVSAIGKPHIGKCGYSAVGAVVGATWPKELSQLRHRIPHTPFLVPGYGAQGAGAEDVRGAFNSEGFGAVVNSSRAICYAYRKERTADWKGAAAREAKRMRDEFRSLFR